MSTAVAKRVDLNEIEGLVNDAEARLVDMVKRVTLLGDNHRYGAHGDSICGTVWQHYKGGMYHIDRLVVHSDDPEQVLVLYKLVTSMEGSRKVHFVRRFDEWLGHVAAEDERGQLVERPRFTPVSGHTITIGLDVSGRPIALSKPFPVPED